MAPLLLPLSAPLQEVKSLQAEKRTLLASLQRWQGEADRLADRLDAADEAAARAVAERHRSVTQQVYLCSWTAAQEVRGCGGTAGVPGMGLGVHLCAPNIFC